MSKIRSLVHQNRFKTFVTELVKNKALFVMLIPGVAILLINNYLPMFGVIMAFKNYKLFTNNFIVNLIKSDWIGFRNFEFFIKTDYAFTITRNTILYNLGFILLGLLTAVPVAIALNELRNRRLSKLYQTTMLLPQFISWVIVGFLAYSFLSTNNGLINNLILKPLGIEPVSWYSEAKYWPFILPIVHIWKHLGYSVVIYLAAIANIDVEMYEAAVIDGANKIKQIIYITIPMLIPMMIMLTLLHIGKIFNADMGLFYQVTQNNGALYETTSVIDTFAYNAFMVMGNAGMSSALGLFQATVGFCLVMVSNYAVNRIDKDSALF